MAEKKLTFNFWFINSILLVALLGAWLLQRPVPTVAADIHLTRIPYLIDNMVGSDVALPPFEADLYKKGFWMNRVYHDTDAAVKGVVWILAVQTIEDRHAHHPPEYCYTGSGWEIVTSREADWEFQGILGSPMVAVAERVSAVSGRLDQDMIVYWFSNGQRIVGSYFERVLWDSWDRLNGAARSWIMVRVVVPLDRDRGEGLALGMQQGKAQAERVARLVDEALRRPSQPMNFGHELL